MNIELLFTDQVILIPSASRPHTHTHICIHTLAFWLCVPFKWIFLYPLFLQSHIYTGHVCLPLSPPSVPPFCHSLNLFLSWGSTVWPQLPLTHALLKLQPINRDSSVPVSDVGSANWNQQQPVVSTNEHFCLCVEMMNEEDGGAATFTWWSPSHQLLSGPSFLQD